MAWNGNERRKSGDRRLIERRHTMRYRVRNLIVVDGVTWIDPDGSERRQKIRRRHDRETLAIKFVNYAHPDHRVIG